VPRAGLLFGALSSHRSSVAFAAVCKSEAFGDGGGEAGLAVIDVAGSCDVTCGFFRSNLLSHVGLPLVEEVVFQSSPASWNVLNNPQNLT